MEIAKELINLFTSIIVCGTAIWGINAWRRELKGKKQFEVAEEVLSLFYECKDILNEIRSPFGYVSEGKTRKRNENESEEDSKTFDRAFVVFERYNKRFDSINKLRTLKYRYMTLISNGNSKCFDDLLSIFKDVLSSAEMLGSIYWNNKNTKYYTEDEKNLHLEEMKIHQSIIWNSGSENDGVNLRLKEALTNVEKELSKILLPKKYYN